MNRMKSGKIRTVVANERGQIVIPEDMRKELGIHGRTTLVLVRQDNEIVVKKELDVLGAIDDESFWKAVSKASMIRAWGKEDDVWDDIARKEGLE